MQFFKQLFAYCANIFMLKMSRSECGAITWMTKVISRTNGHSKFLVPLTHHHDVIDASWWRFSRKNFAGHDLRIEVFAEIHDFQAYIVHEAFLIIVITICVKIIDCNWFMKTWWNCWKLYELSELMKLFLWTFWK